MEKSKFKKHKKFVLILLAIFLGLFVFRLIYQYQNKPSIAYNHHFEIIKDATNLNLLSNRNYASIKYKTTGQSAQSNLDQKYEKIATIQTLSEALDEEEEMVRNYIKKLSGLIQYEKKTGNDGHRRLNLTIGIPPKNFDLLYKNLVSIGQIQEKQITKTDKTNEYNELKAKKASLEIIRQSLIDLKSKNGKINEYMLLENRILEIEQQLQELGVSLGDFDSENEFCTINFTLNEGTAIKIGHVEHMLSALEWTIGTYLKLIAVFCLMALTAYLSILFIEKIKIHF